MMIQQSATQMLYESTNNGNNNNSMPSRNNQHGTMSQASPSSNYSKLQTSPPPIPFMNKNNEIYRSDNSPVQKDSTDMFRPIGGSYVSNNVSSNFQSKEKQSMLPNLRDLLNEAPPSTHVVTESLRMGHQQQQYNQAPPPTQQQNSINYSSSNQNSRTLHSYYSNQSNTTTMPSSNQFHVAHPNLGYEKIPAHTQPTSTTSLYETNNSHSRLSPPTAQQQQTPQHAFNHQPMIHAPPHQQQQYSSRMSPQDNTASSHPHQHTQQSQSQHAFQSMSISPNSALHSNQGNMLNRTIQDLERELEYQSRFIADLERENVELRRELMHVRQQQQQQQQNGHSNVISNGLLAASRIPIRTKRDDHHLTFESKKRSISEVQPTALTTYLTSSVNDSKKRKTASPSASNQTDSNRELSIVDESVDKLNTANMHKYIVKWKGETYVLVSIFKNRTQILNYYVPLYQSQNPDKVCKIVLSNEDYKQLSNENPETVEKKKHAWRVSVFSLDFYNFVKNFQKKNHQQKASSFISFDGSTVQK